MALLDKGASVAAIAAALSFSSSSGLAAPSPPREACRPVSKIEYNSAKNEYLLISRGRVMSERDLSGDANTGIAPFSAGGQQWGVADH
jgi:hypothetical protein